MIIAAQMKHNIALKNEKMIAATCGVSSRRVQNRLPLRIGRGYAIATIARDGAGRHRAKFCPTAVCILILHDIHHIIEKLFNICLLYIKIYPNQFCVTSYVPFKAPAMAFKPQKFP